MKSTETSIISLTHNIGFTLVDLLTALSIFLILTTIAVPSFTQLSRRKAQETDVNSLLHLLNFSRQEAVNRSTHIVICSSENDETCTKDWKYPIIVFVDDNNNHKWDLSEMLLRRHTLGNSQQQLNWRSALNYLSFDANGTTGYQNGRFYFCSTHSEEYRAQLIVYRTGRTRLASEAELKTGCG